MELQADKRRHRATEDILVPAHAMPLLEVSRVSFSYGRRSVLENVSFSVSTGETVAIVGENGAGKSTLLRLLVGLLRPNSGTIRVRGRFGYCPQDSLLFESLTVRENLDYFAAAYGVGENGPFENALLDRLGYRAYEHTLVSQLSAGTCQKLNLTLALLHSPASLVLDEPYAGFDWDTYLRFWELATILRREGHAILAVSHFVHERNRFDRVLDLRDGKIT